MAIGSGATQWLVEAAAVGTRSIEGRMTELVELTKVFDRDSVDRALGRAAVAGRYTIADVLSILATPTVTTTQPSEAHSLQPGTAAWGRLGGPINGSTGADRPHPTPDLPVDIGSQGDLAAAPDRDQPR